MLRDLINDIGRNRIARQCQVTPACVTFWRRNNDLPNRKGYEAHREAYLERLAPITGMSVDELREYIKEGKEKEQAEA